MANSNNKVVLKSVMIARDGKRISPPIGKAFPFTEDEVAEIEKVNPTALRDAVNEDDVADLAEVVALSNSNTRVVPKSAKPGAGKTTAMVDGADGAPESDTQDDGDDDDATALTVEEIEAGVADMDNDALTAALNAERALGKKARKGAIAAYEGEIAKRNAPVDDDL